MTCQYWAQVDELNFCVVANFVWRELTRARRYPRLISTASILRRQ